MVTFFQTKHGFMRVLFLEFSKRVYKSNDLILKKYVLKTFLFIKHARHGKRIYDFPKISGKRLYF